jgi:hypothetical protein
MTKAHAVTTSSNAAATSANTAAAADSAAASLQSLLEQGAATYDALRARLDDARTRGSDLVDRITDLMKQRPLTGVAIAFGIGYVAMRIRTSRLTPLAIVGGLLYLTSGQVAPPKPSAGGRARGGASA